jgi:hypothetical protein
VVSEYSRRNINAKVFSTICETFPAVTEPLRDMQKLLRKKTLGIARWKDLTKHRWEMSNGVYVWRSGSEVVLHFGPKIHIMKNKIMVDLTALDHLTPTRSQTSPRPEHPSTSRSLCEVGDHHGLDVDMSSLPWKAALPSSAGRNGMLMNSHDVSSQSDIKLRSRESVGSSISGSAYAASDISSLTNFSLVLSGNGNDWAACPEVSPRGSLVQISRHAKHLAEVPPPVSVSISAEPHTVQARLCASLDSDSKSAGNSLTYSRDEKMLHMHMHGYAEDSSSGRVSKSSAKPSLAPSRPPICTARAIMARTKIVPTDFDSVSSSDEDTIDGAMGWTKGRQKRR